MVEGYDYVPYTFTRDGRKIRGGGLHPHLEKVYTFSIKNPSTPVYCLLNNCTGLLGLVLEDIESARKEIKEHKDSSPTEETMKKVLIQIETTNRLLNQLLVKFNTPNREFERWMKDLSDTINSTHE